MLSFEEEEKIEQSICDKEQEINCLESEMDDLFFKQGMLSDEIKELEDKLD